MSEGAPGGDDVPTARQHLPTLDRSVHASVAFREQILPARVALRVGIEAGIAVPVTGRA